MDAYVYLRAEPGRVEDVVIELAGRHGLRHAVPVIGEWDVMIAVEGADFEAIARTILREIHPIGGVTRTYTAPVVPLEMMGMEGAGWAALRTPMHLGGRACYVHVSAAAGAVPSIVEALAAVEHVTGVAVVAGHYDVIAEIALPWEEAGRVILEQVHAIPGVTATNTLVGIPLPETGEEE